jgi:hypothetical protein
VDSVLKRDPGELVNNGGNIDDADGNVKKANLVYREKSRRAEQSAREERNGLAEAFSRKAVDKIT